MVSRVRTERMRIRKIRINPLAARDLAEKHVLKLVEGFFGQCRAVEELNLPTNPFPGYTLRGLFSQVLAKFGMRRKQNFDIVFGFKSSTTLSTFTFRFLSFPLFSLSLPHFYYFQLAGPLVGFILVGRVFEKPFIILELDAQKGRWVMEQAFHGDFRSVLHWFFWPFLQFP